MKIFINNRNYLTWPKAMAELFANQGHEIIFLDNASTYEPLLDYYSTCPFKIHRLPNFGNQALWHANLAPQDEFFVFTDPDFDLSMIPTDWPEVLMEGFQRYPHHVKMGLSWEINTVPFENPAYTLDRMDQPCGFTQPLPGGWWNAPCDTSFAIYKPRLPFYIGGIRKDRPYTGIHLPWHIVFEPSKRSGARSVIMDDEMEYYFDHCENSSFTWGRMQTSGMLEEYKRRKANGNS